MEKKEKEKEKNKEKGKNNKEIKLNKKDIEARETRENSSKSTEKNEPITNNMILKSNIFIHKNEKERNIDIIDFKNCIIQEGEPIKEINEEWFKTFSQYKC